MHEIGPLGPWTIVGMMPIKKLGQLMLVFLVSEFRVNAGVKWLGGHSTLRAL